jgi:hypothetical protein
VITRPFATARIRLTDPRLRIGSVIGLAALTGNEASFIGLAWPSSPGALLDRRPPPAVAGRSGGHRDAILGRAIRDWIVFGNPLPGQALANALSVDLISRLNDPPTLGVIRCRPGRLLEMRVEGSPQLPQRPVLTGIRRCRRPDRAVVDDPLPR